MFKTTHVLIPIAVCFVQLSYWNGSCKSTTAKLENITPLFKDETSNSSLEDNPTTTTTVLTKSSGHIPTEAKMTTASIVTEHKYHKVYSSKKPSIPQAGTTEGDKATEPDPTITTKMTGGIIGISREAIDIITSVVVIYIALVVTLVALRLCSSRVLKMQENNQKQKMQKYSSERKCEINIEEVKCQDGTKHTDEIIEISGDSINVTTTNEDVIPDSLSKETAEKLLGDENKNEDANEQNCSKIDENASDTITEKKFLEESTDRMNLLNKSIDDEDENALSEFPVSCEREESPAPLEAMDIIGNKNQTNIDVTSEEDIFPPPPTPTSEVSDMLTQGSTAAPVDQFVVTVLTTAMLKNNKDTTEEDEVTVESTDQ